MDDAVYIGRTSALFAAANGGKLWYSDTPAELIRKLDADGICRERISLILPPVSDHALEFSDVEIFLDLLSGTPTIPDSKI